MQELAFRTSGPKTSVLLLALLASGSFSLSSSFARAGLIKDDSLTRSIVEVMKGVQLRGHRFDPEVHCNSATLENPQRVEVFEVDAPQATVVLCPGKHRGFENVVTIFQESRIPTVVRITPPDDSSRASDEQIQSVVESRLGTAKAKSEAESRSHPLGLRTSTRSEFETCVRSAKQNSKRGFHIGSTFARSKINRSPSDGMALYACLFDQELLLNPEGRLQMKYAAARSQSLLTACDGKRSIDLQDADPQARSGFLMEIRCQKLAEFLKAGGRD